MDPDTGCLVFSAPDTTDKKHTKGRLLIKMTEMIKAAIKKANAHLRSPSGESVRYIIIGGCTTLVDYASYHFMVQVLSLDITVSNVVSTALAVIFAYVTNKLYVFASRTSRFADTAVEFLKFIASRILTMGIEIGGVYLFVSVLGQDSRLGKVEAIVIVIIVNYLLSKFLVFKNNKAE